MVAVNALNLPYFSPFRDLSQVFLLEDPMDTHVEVAPMMEEEDSPSMRELAEQIEAHTEVIDLDNLIPSNAPEGSKTVKPLPDLVHLVLEEVLPVPPSTRQNATP